MHFPVNTFFSLYLNWKKGRAKKPWATNVSDRIYCSVSNFNAKGTLLYDVIHKAFIVTTLWGFFWYSNNWLLRKFSFKYAYQKFSDKG